MTGSSSAWFRKSQMQFLSSSRQESSVLSASASCRRDAAGFDSNILSAALSFIEAPVRLWTIESCSSVASRVRSLTFSFEIILPNKPPISGGGGREIVIVNISRPCRIDFLGREML